MSHGGAALCVRCHAGMIEPAPRRCPRCAAFVASSSSADARRVPLCGRCQTAPPSYDAAVTLADYASPYDALILALKFGRQLAVANTLGAALAERVAEARDAARLPPVDCVAAVPLGPRRLFARGFNQSEELARALARALSLPRRRGLLARQRETPPQARLTLAERQRNVQGVFTLSRHARAHDRPAGLHVMLVDDVMTSGATLEAAARTLKRAGARAVTLAVAFRTRQ
ncbi:comF family protein [Chitinasiproducens palmae]|uniref:ComF family protein n=2 Tax=Chitinasiproducens palmae TaxID=1770053 RepID=A0A1H2PPL0_9BURK|nr:comF family protein [Chitinasiproducens palmae]